MKLGNEFSEYIRSLFVEIQPYCQLCGSNQQCSIHHIFGRESSSMFNGIVLCFKCHKKADNFNVDSGTTGIKFRRDLLYRTLQSFYKNTWWEMYLPDKEKENNQHFLLEHSEDVLSLKEKVV